MTIEDVKSFLLKMHSGAKSEIDVFVTRLSDNATALMEHADAALHASGRETASRHVLNAIKSMSRNGDPSIDDLSGFVRYQICKLSRIQNEDYAYRVQIVGFYEILDFLEERR